MALTTSQVDIEEYYKLVATGLGCLEAVLKVRLASSLSISLHDLWLLTLPTELAVDTPQGSSGATPLRAYNV